MYVSQSVSWLTFLLKLDKYRDISGPEWAILLNFFGDIPRMLLHHFQIILNFLYVCQSVSWLTSLLKLDKYRHISGPEWDIFLKIFGDIPRLILDYCQIILNFCMSLSLLFGLLSYWNLANIGISQVLDEISFWIFLETFPGYFWTTFKLFGSFCMSVSLSYFLTEIMLM